MNTARWTQIKRLFEEALSLPESQHSAFLDEQCVNDKELRSEVESLLTSLTLSGSFLEPPGDPEAEEGDERILGQLFGAYKVVRFIGHGGMGAVYQGSRDDGQYRKDVAIKIARLGVWTKELTERFQRERETLARLDHPNISRLLDSGTSRDGIPFLVMEYVDGMPVDHYADHSKLTIRERLELFRTVCNAVQFAHQNLVVHRDLKPGNILVTPEGVPKLLDFGIAKILNELQQAEPSDVTRAGLRFVTIEYASPEQIRGEPVTTSSDVYSLGVLLYKTLTGRSPYQFSSRAMHDMTKVVCEQEPLRPSTQPRRASEQLSSSGPAELASRRRITPEKLHKELRGDLDNILLKALQKEPHRRYATVEQLSEDIRRYLNGLPVSARRDTVQYRVQKFIQRHAVGVGATMLVVLAIIGGVAGILWQSTKAQRESAKAERISRFLQEMLASADPMRYGKDVTVAQTLEHAVERIEHELGSEPEVAASVLHTIGETELSLGLYERADRDLRRSLAVRESVLGNEHADVSVVLHSLAFLAQLQTRQTVADSLYRLAIDMWKKANGNSDPQLASMLSDYSTLLRERQETEKALRIAREAVSVFDQAGKHNTREYAVALTNLATILNDLREFSESDSLYRLGIAILKNNLGEDHIDVAQAINNFALALVSAGNDDEAEVLFHQSLSIRRHVLGGNHPEVAVGLSNLSGFMLKKGRIAEAESLALQSLELFRSTVNPDNLRLSASLLFLGHVANLRGSASRAETYITEALRIRKSLLPEGHYGIVGTDIELAKTRMLQRRYAEAERILKPSYHHLRATLGDQHAATVTARKYLSELYAAWGKPNQIRSLEAQTATK